MGGGAGRSRVVPAPHPHSAGRRGGGRPRQRLRVVVPAYPTTAVWRLALGVVGLAILLITAAGIAGVVLVVPGVGWGSENELERAQPLELARHFVHWDAGYYLRIAESGYRSDGPERAFFPLYPLLARAVSGLSDLPLVWSGWLISIGCFLGGGVLLHHWLQAEYGERVAFWALAWFSLFPVSFFSVAFYPEALYLLLSTGAIYFARSGRFLASGLCIALAGAARPVGFLLAVPYIVEFLLQRDFRPARLGSFVVGACVAPLGTLSFLAFLSMQGGGANPVALYNDNLERHWLMVFTWPWETMGAALNAALFGTSIGTDWFSRAIAWQDLLFALFGLGLSIWSWGRLRPSMSLWLALSTLFFLSSKGPHGYVFEGMPRHIASILPIYLALALAMARLPRVARWALIGLSAGLLALYAMWFASGRWVS